MNPLPFIIGAYGVILGGLGVYVAWLWRRLAAARAELDAAPPAHDAEHDGA